MCSWDLAQWVAKISYQDMSQEEERDEDGKGCWSEHGDCETLNELGEWYDRFKDGKSSIQ
jgi:hypothetical protein